MLVFVTTPHHAYTIRALAEDRTTPGMPEIRPMPYDVFWRAEALPHAAYILTDIERLTPHERRITAEIRRQVLAAGLPCLNDPLLVLDRYTLLLRLHRLGMNPFRAWRASEDPEPARFPVFLRVEADHARPIGRMIRDQAALEAAIAALPSAGFCPAGVIVVEFCAEPIAPGVWRKYGTWRIGAAISTDHAVIEDNWCVKYGTAGLASEEMFRREYEEVAANIHAEALRPAFEVAGIEWGRADHATVGGQEVIYEINTNPTVYGLSPQRLPVRDETLRLSRHRMAEALAVLDPGPGRALPIEPGQLLAQWRRRSPNAALSFRP